MGTHATSHASNTARKSLVKLLKAITSWAKSCCANFLSSPQGLQQEFHIGQHLEQISNIKRVTIHPLATKPIFLFGTPLEREEKNGTKKNFHAKNCRIRMYFNKWQGFCLKKKCQSPWFTGLTQKSFLGTFIKPSETSWSTCRALGLLRYLFAWWHPKEQKSRWKCHFPRNGKALSLPKIGWILPWNHGDVVDGFFQTPPKKFWSQNKKDTPIF